MAQAPSRQFIEGWIKQNPEVGDWLGSVANGTRPLYAKRLYDLIEWLTAGGEFKGFAPAQLLDFQDKAAGRDRVKLANRLGAYCAEKAATLRPKTVSNFYSAAHSFFSFHGCNLPRRGFSLPDNHKEPAPQVLDAPKLYAMITAAKPRDRAIFTIMFQSFSGEREFAHFNNSWAVIAPQLEAGAQRLYLPAIPARKKARGLSRGYPMVIGVDGVRLLRDYIKHRGTPGPGEPIFLRANRNRSDEPIGTKPPTSRALRADFMLLARRCGLIGGKGEGRTHRTGINLHQLRDTARSEWQRSGADPLVAEALMGHVVDPNAYLKLSREYILEQYAIAEKRLSPIGNPTPDKVSVDEVQRLTTRLDNYEKILKEIYEREKPTSG